MAMIQVQVGKNIIEDILLDGGCGINIMEELQKQLRFPDPKSTSYYRFGESNNHQTN
jgi:hypothetical protein